MSKSIEFRNAINEASEKLRKYPGPDTIWALRGIIAKADSHYADPFLHTYTGAAMRHLDAALKFKRHDKIKHEIDMALDRVVRIPHGLDVADERKYGKK